MNSLPRTLNLLKKMEPNKIHYNIPQLLYYIIQTRITVAIWGRGTGKSTGPLADFSLENWSKMPRSNGALFCNTYTDILTKVLPAVMEGWQQRRGITQDIHYWVGKYAPAKLKREKAFRYPIDPRHYVHFFNGAGMFLVSGDRATSNGFNLDWAGIDEARLQKYDKVREFLLTVRGNAAHFGHLSNHGSILYTTDMPRHSKERWILDFKKEMDERVIHMILQAQKKVMDLEAKYEKEPSRKTELEIVKWMGYVNELRKQTTYVSFASTLDNIHALGLDPIKNFKRQLSDLDFATSVLNKEMIGVANSFYGLLDIDQHGYTMENYSFIDDNHAGILKGKRRDCRWHSDIDFDQPLEISCDYNASINSVVTGQQFGMEYRFPVSLYVKRPKYLKDLAHDWCDYFEYHRCKVVTYVYDNTAIGDNAKGDLSFADEWIKILQSRGWQVNAQYIRQSPSHASRHLLWNECLSEEKPDLPMLRFNKVGAAQLLVSMQQVQTKQIGSTFKKDKSTERESSGVAPEDAPHLSEAADILLHYKFSGNFSPQSEFTDNFKG